MHHETAPRETAHPPVETGAVTNQAASLLIQAGRLLSGHVRARVKALPDAVPALIAVLDDPALQKTQSPGEGYAPIHAATLLGELKDAAAIGPLLDALRRSEPMEIIHSTLIDSLTQFGRLALEPALAAAAAAGDQDYEEAVASVVAELGVRDPRVFELLLRVFERKVDLGAAYLAQYGDPAALPVLHQAFEGAQVVEGNALRNSAVTELRAAIEDLGGELTPAEQAKVRGADQVRRRWLAGLGLGRRVAAAPKPGRNDLCPCGSGKKYKKCHLLQE